MQPAIIDVPLHMIRARSIMWDIDFRTAPAGQTLNGRDQVVVSEFPRWIGRVDMVLARSLIGHWRARRWTLAGQTNWLRVPMWDPAVFDPGRHVEDWPDRRTSGLPFSTGARFSTGQGFAYLPQVRVAETAEAGATQLRVTAADAWKVPRVGQILSVGDWPFGVVAVTAEGDDVYLLDVRMPLRAAIEADADVQLIARGLFRLEEDASGQITYGHEFQTASSSLALVEVLSR